MKNFNSDVKKKLLGYNSNAWWGFTKAVLQGTGIRWYKRKPELLLLFRARHAKIIKKINNCILPICTLSPPSAGGVVFAGALGTCGGKPHCILPPSQEDSGMLVGDPGPPSATPYPSIPDGLPAAPWGTSHTLGIKRREIRRYF